MLNQSKKTVMGLCEASKSFYLIFTFHKTCYDNNIEKEVYRMLNSILSLKEKTYKHG